MTFLRLLPPILATWLLAAHWSYHALPWLVYPTLALPLLFLVRRPWVPRFYARLVMLASLEWVRTLVITVQERAGADEPWLRYAIIMIAVAVFTLLTALPLRSAALRRTYGAP